jgi:hypothetical protein
MDTNTESSSTIREGGGERNNGVLGPALGQWRGWDHKMCLANLRDWGSGALMSSQSSPIRMPEVAIDTEFQLPGHRVG